MSAVIAKLAKLAELMISLPFGVGFLFLTHINNLPQKCLVV